MQARVAPLPMCVFNWNSPLFNQGDQVHKSVFIIFFQGDQLKNRVKKICEGSVLSVMKWKFFGWNMYFSKQTCVLVLPWSNLVSKRKTWELNLTARKFDPKVSNNCLPFSMAFAEQRAEEVILLELAAHCRANIHSHQRHGHWSRRCKLHTETLTPSSSEPRTFLRQQC